MEWETVETINVWYKLIDEDHKAVCALANGTFSTIWHVYINVGEVDIDWEVTSLSFEDVEVGKAEVLKAYV